MVMSDHRRMRVHTSATSLSNLKNVSTLNLTRRSTRAIARDSNGHISFAMEE